MIHILGIIVAVCFSAAAVAVSSPSLWLDASMKDSVQVFAGTNRVLGWRDLSPQSTTVATAWTPNNINAPYYSNISIAFTNPSPSLSLNNQLLQVNSMKKVGFERTIFIAFRLFTTADPQSLFRQDYATTNGHINTFFVRFGNTFGSAFMGCNGNIREYLLPMTSPNFTVSLFVPHVVTVVNSADALQVWFDGTYLGSETEAVPTFCAENFCDPSVCLPPAIGGWSTDNSFMDGGSNIGEILLYAGAMESTQRSFIETALLFKWRSMWKAD